MAHSKRLIETVLNLLSEVIYLCSFSFYRKIDFQKSSFIGQNASFGGIFIEMIPLYENEVLSTKSAFLELFVSVKGV